MESFPKADDRNPGGVFEKESFLVKKLVSLVKSVRGSLEVKKESFLDSVAWDGLYD